MATWKPILVATCGYQSFFLISHPEVIESVVATWPGQVQLVSGRPRHLQSQGLVEQAHYTLERMMSAKISDSGVEHPPWVDWLPHITCKYVLYVAIFIIH